MVKQVIYETHGRAREFSELAINLFAGCGHKCLYCYGPAVTHTDEDTFQNDPRPRVTPSEIASSATQMQKAGEKRPVLLCFVTDPYCPIEAESQLTRQAIQALYAHNLNVVVLTKAGKRATRDFDLLGPGDAFATTLTCVDDETSLWWEPSAARPMERMESLIEASCRGIKTWVSLEPVIYPQATKQLILLTKEFVGHYKVGLLNYHPWAAKVDWHTFGWQIKEFMDEIGVHYYVKADLAKYMGRARGFWNYEGNHVDARQGSVGR